MVSLHMRAAAIVTSKRDQLLRVESYDIQLDLTAGEKLFRSQSVIIFDHLR
jgi:hypothetical protein